MVWNHGLNPPLSAVKALCIKDFLSLARPFLDLVSQTPRPSGRGRPPLVCWFQKRQMSIKSFCPFERIPRIGASQTGSAITGSTIDVRIDDAGPILKFRIAFAIWFSAVASQLRPSFSRWFWRHPGTQYWILYRVLIVDRGTIPYLPPPFPILRQERPNL